MTDRATKLRKDADRCEKLEYILKNDRRLLACMRKYLATQNLEKEVKVECFDLKLFVVLELLGYGGLSVNKWDGTVAFYGSTGLIKDATEIVQDQVETVLDSLREEVKELLR